MSTIVQLISLAEEKTMQKSRSLIVILLSAVLMALIFTSCGKDDSSSSNGGTHELVGAWNLTSYTVNGQNMAFTGSSTMTFRSDNTFTGTATEDSVTETSHGTWSTSGSSLTIIVEGVTTTISYSVSGNKCTLTMTEDGVTAIMEYTKQ